MQQPLFIIIYDYLHDSAQNMPILLYLEARLTALIGVLIENIGSFLKDIISTWQVKWKTYSKEEPVKSYELVKSEDKQNQTLKFLVLTKSF